MKLFDTIAAIATPIGTGGVAIIRISGDNSEEIAQKIIKTYSHKPLTQLESHKLTLSGVYSLCDDTLIDEALISVMRAPHSYTGENVVEINCHGGYLAAKLILEELLKSGARLAEAGEFTRRAFINGKTDLTRAEATIDLINSNSALGLENAANALGGKLSKKINSARDNALALASHISAIADYPDEIDDMTNSEFMIEFEKIEKELKSLTDSFNTGKMLRDGIYTVIIGRPNVGKSSILNALSREERAIVTDIPGTTRDVIEEYINLGGISLRLLDTAGIRENADIVEQKGIERALENMKRADLCLFVLDSSDTLSDEDIRLAKELKGKNTILILNKTDKTGKIDTKVYEDSLGIPNGDIVMTSTPQNAEATGIDRLEALIFEKFINGAIDKNQVYLSSQRQYDSLIKAEQSLAHLKESLTLGVPHDILYIDLEDVIAYLGEVTGETVQDEIIEQVFSRFCVGK